MKSVWTTILVLIILVSSTYFVIAADEQPGAGAVVPRYMVQIQAADYQLIMRDLSTDPDLQNAFQNLGLSGRKTVFMTLNQANYVQGIIDKTTAASRYSLSEPYVLVSGTADQYVLQSRAGDLNKAFFKPKVVAGETITASACGGVE